MYDTGANRRSIPSLVRPWIPVADRSASESLSDYITELNITMGFFKNVGRQIERFKQQTQTAAEEATSGSGDVNDESGAAKDHRDDEPQSTRN